MGDNGKRRRTDGGTVSPDQNPYLAHTHERGDVNPLTNRPYSPRYYDILKVRKTLPIYEARHRIMSALEKKQVIVLEGETGSGKTTQVPQFLVEDGYALNGKCVVCTQPRRVAAINVARRVAEEMDVKLGNEVGYSIRFEDHTSQRTCLKYATDGMLLREAMTDPNLDTYSVVVLDEAHERTMSTDILLGLLKGLIKKRTDLKIIIMSATMDASKFRKYFDFAPLLKVPGRMFPVEMIYSKEPEDDYVRAAVRVAVDVHRNEPPGDVLIFLTGEDEIEDSCRQIAEKTSQFARQCGDVVVLPLYSTLPQDKQQRVFDRAPPPSYPGGPPGRKIICATNIAETSLTIDGVVYVIDTGFAKQKVYNPRVRVESLLVTPISRASAKQRSGRAGRTRAGKCFRLYTEESFYEHLTEVSHPEILRCNLASVVLTLLELGISDLVHFDFMDPPAPETLMRALELLNYLGGISDEGELTDFGRKMAEYPLEPEQATALLRSEKYGCSEQVLSIVAMTSAGSNCFHRVKGDWNCDQKHQTFHHRDGDHMTLLNVFNRYKHSLQERGGGGRWCYDNYINQRALITAENVRLQLTRVMRRQGVNMFSLHDDDPQYSAKIRQALLEGYFMQVAKKSGKGNSYYTIKDQQAVVLHPSCALTNRPEWVFYNEFVLTKKRYIRCVSEAKGRWLIDIAPHYYDLSNFPMGETKHLLTLIYRKKEREIERNRILKERERRKALRKEESDDEGWLPLVPDG